LKTKFPAAPMVKLSLTLVWDADHERVRARVGSMLAHLKQIAAIVITRKPIRRSAIATALSPSSPSKVAGYAGARPATVYRLDHRLHGWALLSLRIQGFSRLESHRSDVAELCEHYRLILLAIDRLEGNGASEVEKQIHAELKSGLERDVADLLAFGRCVKGKESRTSNTSDDHSDL
jgi:hypothetical protein